MVLSGTFLLISKNNFNFLNLIFKFYKGFPIFFAKDPLIGSFRYIGKKKSLLHM